MGCAAKVLNNPLTQIVSDVAAVATGNPELIPLINAGERTAGGLAKGESFGKALGQGAISGGEALAGQELAGAVGIGEGNSAFNKALGINISPAATGLPNIGGFISDTASKAMGGVSDFLGISGGSGTTVPDSSVGQSFSGTSVPGEISTPSVPTAASTGGGFTSASSLTSGSSPSVDALLGASTSSPTSLGSLTPQLGGASASDIDSLSAPFSAGVTSAASSIPSGAASATAPTSGGFMSSLESAAGKAALPLGAAAYSAMKGPEPLPSAAHPLELNGTITAPLAATEKTGLDAYNSGTLTAPQQATVLKYVQEQQNQLIQQLVNSGVTDFRNDSRYLAGMEKIQQDSIAMQGQMLQQTFNNAFSAAGAAGQNLSSVANEQVALDKDFQDAMASAFAGIGSAAGGGAFRAGA
jgi:hypothetical protein